MDYFPLPAREISELLLVFVLGALVGRAFGYWQHCREMLRRHDMLQRITVPFEERFRSPLNARRWPIFWLDKPLRSNRREQALPPDAGETAHSAF